MIQKSVVVTGPTASGKTKLAIALAKKFNGEIISVDSRQVFKGMDIGTGKDLKEYEDVPYHLIDIVSPNEDYNLSEFLKDAKNAFDSICARGKLPIFCGGTPMWIHALLAGYEMKGTDPKIESRTALESLSLEERVSLFKTHYPLAAEVFKEWQNPVRLLRAIEIARDTENNMSFAPLFHLKNTLIIAPFYHRLTIHKRVYDRLQTRLEEGMIDEIKTLVNQGVSQERLDFFGLEYRYVAKHIFGNLCYTQMFEDLLVRIRKFVKRQDIWFRKFERDGFPIYWIKEGDVEKASQYILSYLNGDELPEPEIILNEIHYPKHVPLTQ